MFAVVVCLFLSLLIHRTIVSKRTYGVVLDVSTEEAAAAVESCFLRVTWANTTGPGLINRARVNNSRRVLIVSVGVYERDEGAEVRVWISNRHSIAGITYANGALKAVQIRSRLRHPVYLRGTGGTGQVPRHSQPWRGFSALHCLSSRPSEPLR